MSQELTYVKGYTILFYWVGSSYFLPIDSCWELWHQYGEPIEWRDEEEIADRTMYYFLENLDFSLIEPHLQLIKSSIMDLSLLWREKQFEHRYTFRNYDELQEGR